MTMPPYPYVATPRDIEPAMSPNVAMSLVSKQPNYPFAPPKYFIPIRINLPAGSRIPLFTSTTPCQKVAMLNEGPGDFEFGTNALSLTSPPSGSSQPAFALTSGAGFVLEVEDASQVYIGSVAGTIVSIVVIALPVYRPPGTLP